MKEGSLVTPSAKMLDEIPHMIAKFNFKFIPRIPTKDDIYVVKSLYKGFRGNQCVEVDGLEVMRGSGLVQLNIWLFDEVQGPDEVNIAELMEETQLEPA